MPGHARQYSAVSCAKRAELIKMLFGVWTWVVQRKHVLSVVHTGIMWRVPLNRPCAAAMRPYCQITLTTCCHLLIFGVYHIWID